MLELNNKNFGPQIRIIREVSSLEPAPKCRSPKSRSEHVKLITEYVFLDLFIGLHRDFIISLKGICNGCFYFQYAFTLYSAFKHLFLNDFNVYRIRTRIPRKQQLCIFDLRQCFRLSVFLKAGFQPTLDFFS